jgi:hypothetical protein
MAAIIHLLEHHIATGLADILTVIDIKDNTRAAFGAGGLRVLIIFNFLSK